MKAGDDTPFRGYEVFVQTEDGNRLNEYEDPDDDGEGKTVYLECPEDSDKPFQIHFGPSTGPTGNDTLMDFYLDGRTLRSTCVHGTHRGSSSIKSMYVEEECRTMEYKLSFGKVNLVEAETKAALATSLGEIQIRFQVGKMVFSGAQISLAMTEKSVRPINEKLKKASLDRSVVGINGVPVLLPTAPECTFYPAPHDQTPYVMRFKYMTRQTLKAKGIIPAEPLPQQARLQIGALPGGFLPRIAPIQADENAAPKREAKVKVSNTPLRVKREALASMDNRPAKKKRQTGRGSKTDPITIE